MQFLDSSLNHASLGRLKHAYDFNSRRLTKVVLNHLTNGTCGHTSQTELLPANQAQSSSRTSKDTLPSGCVTSCATWDEWVTEQRGECLARLKSARLINASGSSSSGGFPTPVVGDSWTPSSEASAKREWEHGNLRGVAAASWPTPQANEIESPAKEYRSATNAYRGDKKVQPMLADACKKNWQTPRVSDERDGSRNRIYKPEAQLREQVMRKENWPTPTTAEAEKISNRPNYGQKGLSNHPAIVGDTEREKLAKSRSGQAGPAKRSTIGKNPEQWPTPRAAENDENLETWDKRRERKQKEGINLHLPLSVKVRKEDNWPTPRAGNPRNRKPGTGGKVLSEEAKNWPTPLEDDASNVNPSDKRMKTLVSSTKGSGMKLNPNWVEQLMGLPAGWTQLPAHWLTG